MILQRLTEYYDRIVTDPEAMDAVPRPGYSRQKISFCVVLEPNGALQQFQSLADLAGKRLLPRQLLVPGQSKASGAGINPCFLWDNAAYMLGFKADDPNPKRTRESFEAFCERHLSIEAQVSSPAFSAVCAFLREWSPGKAMERAAELRPITENFGVFRIGGEQRFIHDDPLVASFWLRNESANPTLPVAMCLVTGHDAEIARLHEPKIKGVRGAQSSGALLVSFNDEAYKSFGKDQSHNAPVSTAAVFKYANGLNHLLSRADRRFTLGDSTVVFWTERRSRFEEFVSELLAGVPPAEDVAADSKKRADEVRLFLSQVRSGYASDEAIDPEDTTRFYILALSPNASRLSVRFWADSTVAEMKARLLRHVESLEICGSSAGAAPLTVRGMVNATARIYNGKPDYDTVSPRLAGDVARAVVTGSPFPAELLAALLARIAADGQITHLRASVIKSFLIREGKVPMDVYLNREHPEIAYHCGRLLAVLAFAQERALGTVNAGVIRRNLGSVMATPGLRLGRLQQAAEVGHIPKLSGDLPIFIRDEMKAISVAMRDGPPVTLDLRLQGVFMLGFYQELQSLDFVGVQIGAGKRVRTLQGEWVRSKGEARLAELLTKLALPYVYEPRAILRSGVERWPDFVIRGSTPADDIYIEYLGMATEEYNKRWEQKLAAYIDHGISEEGGARGRLVVLDARSKPLGDVDMLNVIGPLFDANFAGAASNGKGAIQ